MVIVDQELQALIAPGELPNDSMAVTSDATKCACHVHENRRQNSTSTESDVTQGYWAGRHMRRRLRKFLPIVLIAVAVQLLAPIAACWAAAIAASAPLSSLEICHSDPTAPPGSADPHAQDGSCPICCLAQSQASFDTPQPVAFSIPRIIASPVIWRKDSQAELRSRHHTNAQARAPPQAV